MKKRLIIAMATGLTIGCGDAAAPEPTKELSRAKPRKYTNPSPPKVEPAPPPIEKSIRTNLPPPLPRWDQVPSNHPEGATNPPSPVLIVTHAGDCYKAWVEGIPENLNRMVETCTKADCGRPIKCNEEGGKMYEEWKAKHP